MSNKKALEKMKIVFATHEGVPLYGGGPNVKIHALKSALIEIGVDVELFDLWNAKDQLENCDLVHLFGGNFAVYNLARNLKFKNVKYVVNPIFYSRRSPKTIRRISKIDLMTRRLFPGMWWEWGFTRDICDWAEMVLPNTIDEGKILSESFDIPSQKVSVLHNGVSTDFLKADPTLFEQKYGIKDFILYVGHIGPARKNVIRLLEALKNIDHPAVIIAHILETEESQRALKLIEENQNILFIRGLPNQSPLLASAYAAAKVFVLPSQFETPGRAAMEAALTKANIVITPFGGTKEYFLDHANYIDPYSVESIQNGIEKSINKTKNDQLKSFIEANFSWKTIAKKNVEYLS